MRIVSTSYSKTDHFNHPGEWLNRISFYTIILEELAKRHQVNSIERINYEGTVTEKGVTYHFIRQRQANSLLPFNNHRLVRKLQPDIVFVNGFIFPFQLMQLRWWIGPRPRIIVLHRAEKPFRGFKKQVQKLADRFVNAYLFTSAEFGIPWIGSGIINDVEKIHEVIQSSSSFQPGNRYESGKALKVNGKPIFLWVGRLDENKDPLTVVKGFMMYLEVNPAAKLYMIFQEDGLLEEVRKLLTKSPLATGAVTLVGKVSHADIGQWYNAADFIISGSHYEGSGIAVCEAMSCGCIPILTDITSFRKMSGPGACGLLYEAGNPDSLLERLLEIGELDLQVEREKVLRQFKEELSIEAVARKMEEVIARVS
jgi:glycosyltransferase involved in cell wall biosynthesis